MSKQFENALNNLEIIENDRIQLRLNADIYGYLKKTHYLEFKQIISKKLNLNNYIYLHKIELSSNYGYINFEEEVDEPSSYPFFRGQNSTHFSIEDIIVDPYTSNANFILVIEGEPEDIAVAAETMELFVELDVMGCSSSIPFWKQSMYSGYLMFKNNNFLGSFMHLIIAFEGLLRSSTDNENESIHRIYKTYTSTRLPEYLDAYRELRNKVMHGNENIAKELTETDIELLVETIENLYLNKSVVNKVPNTVALRNIMSLS